MNYVIDHIPLSTPCRRRQGLTITPTTITIHNNANETSTAQNERNWLVNPLNQRQASFHIAVDEHMAVECIPLNEKALHAGDREGNETSISIEICESGDYAKTLENAVELVAKMLKERGWGVDRLRKHQDWSGKICPRKMYDGGKWTGWTEFKEKVSDKLSKPKMDMKEATATIQSLQKLWGLVGDKAKQEEIHRVTDHVRDAAGIPKTV